MTLREIFALRLARIVAFLLVSAARILRNAARFRRVGLVLWRVPISGPFPDIADHVMERHSRSVEMLSPATYG